MSARKVALLVLIVAFAASVETAWNVRGDVRFGPEGCRVMGGRFYGPSWAFEATAEHALDAALVPRLEVDNAYGSVRVVAGAAGVVKVRLRKVVFLPTEEKARAFAERIELRIAGEGESVRVFTNRRELSRGDETGFETHLEIETPAASVARVRNEHGRVDLAGIAAADSSSSFEAVVIERVAGDVKLEARHGDVRVDAVGGQLELDSRHGSVSVSGVTGASRLDVQHGGLEVRRAAAVEIGLKHGDLTLERIGGDLLVRSQHSSVSGSDLAGSAELESSFGDVRLERVGGELRARVQHGGMSASDVSGGATIEVSHDGVTLERVAGAVEVVVQHGGLEARGLGSGALVRVSGSDVTLDGFSGAVDVEVERGSARLAPGIGIAAGLTARARHGSLLLEVPEGSGFELEAESEHGRVEAPLAGLLVSAEQRRGQRGSGRHGSGDVSVRLKADGDVTLESRPARSRDGWAAAPPRSTSQAVTQPAEAPAATPR